MWGAAPHHRWLLSILGLALALLGFSADRPQAAINAAAAAPTISSFSPTSGPIGRTVTINGSGFNSATGVTLCLVPTTFTVVSSNRITASVPAGACNGLWRVTTPAGTAASASAFRVTTPTLTTYSPTSGGVGSTVTLTGTNLNGATQVTLCLVPTTFTIVSSSRVTATVPAGACDGLWRVTTPAGTGASGSPFTVTNGALAIGGFAPTTGGVGSTVTLSGSGFSGASQVSLCLVPTTFTLVSATTITAAVPGGACDGLWRVTTSAGTAASGSPFTVSTGALAIGGFSPTAGGIGSTVTLNGSGFSGASQVSLCLVPTTFTLVSATTITAAVPDGACDGLWRVSTPAGTAASGTPFTNTSPTLTSFSPTSGSVASTVTLNGTNLSAATQVSLCFVPTTFTVASASQITAAVPAGACDGLWRVTTPAGVTAAATPFTNTNTPPPPPPPGSGTANLWLDTNGGSCTRLTSPGAYVDAQACGSMQAAANVASAGDTINILDGTYPGQELSGTKALTFRAAGPGRPSFGQLISSASNLTVQGILIENRNAQPTPFCSNWTLDYTLFVCAPNNTYDDVVVDGLHHPAGDSERRGGIELSGGSGFVFKNGEIRGIWDSKGFQGGADNMLLENNYWHDIKLTPAGGAAGVHNECAYITDGNSQTWRGNRFMFCPVMAMFFANWLGGPPFSNVTVENNVFTHTLNEDASWHDGSSFVIPNGAGGQNQVNNWVVRYNTFEVPPDITSTPGTGDDNHSAQFYGNLGADPDCGLPEWTYSYNVGSTCGATGEVSVANAVNTSSSRSQSPFYVDAPNGDFHLRAGVVPVDRGDPSRYPARDNDGTPRPVGSAADAGAYEWH
jgi:hypothetical protein